VRINLEDENMNRLSKSKRNALRHFDNKNKDLKPDLKAVSEAIGTILLLAISVSLVGVLAMWVESLPEQTPTVEVDMEATMEDFANHIVRIDHNGGDDLDLSQIEVYVKVDGVTKEIYQFHNSKLTQFADGYWSIGENWTRNIGSLHNWNISTPEVTLVIIDINADRIILSDNVQRTGELGNLPDLKISEEDIDFRYQNETLRDGDWVNITARVFNFGSSDAASVIVRFFDGSNIISNNNDDYCFIGSIPIGSYRTVEINWTPTFFGLRTVNVKVYTIQLETNYMNNHASKKLEIEPTIPRITGPNLEIEDILFNPTTPTHGDWVTITVVVKNVGDEEVPMGRTINLTLWDEEGYLLTKAVMFKFNTTLTDNITQYETMQPPFIYNSQTTFGGKTKIKAEITVDITESRYDDNYMDKYIQILPTILLVDDDGYFESYSKEDVSSYMDAALQLAVGSGQFDIWWVKGTDGPKFSSGDKPLRNYDIVIWMTGYQTVDTLTISDQKAISLYLENNGKLWLIGMNTLEDLRIQAGYPAGTTTSFVRNYLGVDKYNITGTPQLLYGVHGENLTEGMQLNTTNLVKAKDNGINLTLRQSTINSSIDGILGNDEVLGIDGNMSLKYYNQTDNFTFKVVYFGWEFASIIDMINRNNLTSQILKWFGWELEIGTDLAISSKGFSDSSPNFMDWITITASVRNNGPNDLTRVRVDFFIVDSAGRETRIPEYGTFEPVDNPQYLFMKSGDDTPVEKKWLAVDVGRHTFKVVVDLEDEIEEVSEENNDDFYSPLFVTQLYIGYTILVVDDDNSTNNGGSNINATSEITSALTELGYFYDTIVVPGAPLPGIGPNITVMKHYNTVIWCTGYEDVNTLLLSDRENLTHYFTRGFPEADFLGETRMNAWVIGQGILDDLGGPGPAMSPATSSFIYRYFRVKGYSTESSTLSKYLDGVNGDNITHGVKYPMIDSLLDEADTITPTNDAKGIFWQDEKHTKLNALRYNSSNYNIVFMPWIYSLINDSTTVDLVDESYKSELMYLILRWFQYPDERFELKTSAIDIELSSYNPVLGSSYIIKTDVYNLGINDTNAIVRFLDGETVINTKSIFVPSNGNSSTEVIWSPLFAGYRDICVAVDPENDTKEVFDVLNNNATIDDQIVYFFFDDLENGSSNWNHDSTIMLINAESPLEYMDKPVFSDVNSSWDYSESYGYMVNSTEYHSYNNSFFTYEPLGAKNKVALDIVLTLDTSGSMGGTPISDLRTAATNFINNKLLDARDRVAIYTFRNEAPYRSSAFTSCDTAGKTALNNIISGLTASGYTPIWDTIGTATNYILTQGSTRIPIVIAMTDGEDYGNEGGEDGSETYCPWHEWGTGQQR
jgi:FlaG/FlaF family flagellin (archaellin)